MAAMDPEIATTITGVEAEIATLLRERGVSDVTSEHTSLGTTYERTQGRVRRYIAFKVARSDIDPLGPFPARGEIFFSFRFGQWWDHERATEAYTATHRLSDEPEALGEPEFDAARLGDRAFTIAGMTAWIVEWRRIAAVGLGSVGE